MRMNDTVIRRTLDTDANPTAQVVQVVADQKGIDPTNLRSAWDAVGRVLDPLFSTASPDADVEVTFRYEGYRITVEQNGSATFDEL